MSFGVFRTARSQRPVIGALIVTAALVGGGCSADTDEGAVATTTTTTVASTTTAAPTMSTPTSTPTTTAPAAEPTVPPEDNGGGGEAPLEPTGAFLSAHRLPAGDAEVMVRSICQTSPGATCVISFTRGDTTRSLPEQTVDDAGRASWNWRPAEIGLDPGHWDVQVTASLNGQERSVTDAIGLEMVP